MKNFILGFIILMFIGSIMHSIAYYNSDELITITISDKDRITTGYGENITSKYIIYTEDEVFENTDALFFGKWNSADLQNQLKVGETYNVKVAGCRITYLSSFRNIIEIK